ncbi:anhydro-N-acetylmuramic acid kinase [Roseiarcus fermentans]|uniref:Anhydro-N-acetylmuramic acid kinase n=1 Tax=Roseiarcus fermentans TaxID=1473586 RepID=A0A366ETA2_9HYPH|nr:anhydro-N-acetylmuramic acid kinase [Roseiarcus fermentans]RBP05146.1 anhydro-N-acetylmuramic acid kinase [Roseiarcus fermentans]
MTGPGLTRAIGVISGTSMDGIDVALIASDGEAQVETGPAATFPYPPDVAARLRAVVADASEAERPQAALERAVTDAHVAAVDAFFARFAIARDSVALVGLHGQTILHRPGRVGWEGRRPAAPGARDAHPPKAGLTRQLCDGARAAGALGIDVVCDFRSADVAAAGEGAPLAPVYHAAMAAGRERPLMILNWGGVGNVTWLGRAGEIVAFDTGPANALIDDILLSRRGVAFDAGGALAASGRADAAILAALMRDRYFDRPPPKSLDRNHFAAAAAAVEALGDADAAATLAAFTVEATVAALARVPEAPKRWLVGGGGRLNAFLMSRLADRLGVPVEPVEAIGFDGDAIEAQCFAYLALRARRGLPLSFPTTTGVPAPTTGGVFWPAPR